MSDKLIPEKIRDFLVQRLGRRYCDSCIQERLGLRWRQQVQLVTATLAVTRSFTRELGNCCTCHQSKYVIAAVRMTASTETLTLSRPEKPAPIADRGHRQDVALIALPQRQANS